MTDLDAATVAALIPAKAVEAAAEAIGEYPNAENLAAAQLMLEAAMPHIAVNFAAYEIGKAVGQAEATARERERIRDGLWALHVDATTRGGWMPGWHRFAELLDGDDDG